MTTMKVIVLISCIGIAVALSKDYVSEVRQNFGEKSNSDLNNQMAAFQRTSLVYMAYASYFDRSNVNLPGFRKFFLAASESALKDSQKVMDYINIRGGHQQFPIIDMNAACKMMKVPKVLQGAFPDHNPKICDFVLKKDPSASLKVKKGYFSSLFGGKKNQDQSSDEDWQTGLMGLSDALLMERTLNRQLLDVANGAAQRGDRHLRHTMEDLFLGQKTERIKKLVDVITRLRHYTGEEYPLGEYVIDLEMSG